MPEEHTLRLDPGERENIEYVYEFFLDVTWDDILDADPILDKDLVKRWKTSMRFYHALTGLWRMNGGSVEEMPELMRQL